MVASIKPRAAAFIAGLTTADQLTPREQQQAKRADKDALKEARFIAWLTARAVFHEAMSAETLARRARRQGASDAVALCLRHAAAVADLIEATNRFMLLPLVNRDDLRERRVLLRKWREAAQTADTHPPWQAAEQR